MLWPFRSQVHRSRYISWEPRYILWFDPFQPLHHMWLHITDPFLFPNRNLSCCCWEWVYERFRLHRQWYRKSSKSFARLQLKTAITLQGKSLPWIPKGRFQIIFAMQRERFCRRLFKHSPVVGGWEYSTSNHPLSSLQKLIIVRYCPINLLTSPSQYGTIYEGEKVKMKMEEPFATSRRSFLP